jgi:CheY-like chemotaxis protein
MGTDRSDIAGESDGPAVGAPSRWVLVVAQDLIHRMHLFRLVERGGHHATVADDPTHALELVATEPFDLMLLGDSIPDRWREQLLQGVGGNGDRAHLPVLVLRRADQHGRDEQWIDMGAEACVPWPLDARKLAEWVLSTRPRVPLEAPCDR